MAEKYITRLLKVTDRSFFLFGPRGTGKSTWLRRELPDAVFVDLLDSSVHLELSYSPARLEAMVGDKPRGAWVVLDEVQKEPVLLDEVHRLMEKKGWRFALCGSSARKIRRGGVNLLGGRALTRELSAFSCRELGKLCDIDFSMEWGFLPLVQFDRQNAADLLNSYVSTYIREEIKQESVVRKLTPFLRFLNIAGQLNAQQINASNVAREAMVGRSTVDSYFSVLIDTLLGDFLPAYRPGAKVRESAHAKFYWFDPGVARAAAGLLFEPVDRLWLGGALETIILHEMKVYNHTSNLNRLISFYRSAGGAEIDFIIETKKRRPDSKARIVCIEVKLAEKWDRRWERPMRSLAEQGKVHVEKMLGVYTGKKSYHFDGVEVLPVGRFLERLYDGEVL